MQVLDREVVTPRLDRSRGKDLGELRERGHLSYVDHPLTLGRARRNPGGLEVDRPGIAGRSRRELRHRHRVVGLVRVAAVGRRPVRGRDVLFERVDRDRARGRVLTAGEREHPREVVLIRLARGFERRVILQVVVAVGQPEPRLREPDQVRVGVLVVDLDAHVERTLQPERRVGQDARHVLERRSRVDAREIGRRWLERGRLDLRRVHDRLVQVAELPLFLGQVGPAVQVREDRGEPLVVPDDEIEERAGGRTVRRDLRGLDPAVVGVAEEVGSRSDRGIDVVERDAPGRDHGRARGLRGCGRRVGRECEGEGEPERECENRTGIHGFPRLPGADRGGNARWPLGR